ncbi:MAG: FKBP-type peptidyl-prolyl cis-trans isomerase, partial [Bdellovibrionales bacterium]|nr:FKBP-type peptidyl-prolyl cis-trans isomerase [Bdellovibrionales bacterium]
MSVRAFLITMVLLFAVSPVLVCADEVTTDSGLRYVDHLKGTGAEAANGKRVSVHYTGWLDNGGKKGKKFDSSYDRQ